MQPTAEPKMDREIGLQRIDKATALVWLLQLRLGCTEG